jgi:hypothetical protein
MLNTKSVIAGWGDPHYVTFDGAKYDFMGQGSYYLSKSLDGQFAVITSIERCDWKNPQPSSVSCTRFVYLKYNNSFYQAYMNDSDINDNNVVRDCQLQRAGRGKI